ncbi:N-acetylglucosamine-1-phosphotransferase subunits alpha/beta-like [Littorina saxatilis]|uniref:N-acetylglucosamine-1-phosphotransferase subunits alpha/beta-like n=1 Tax=Littorina saxatilis TaxID=31220 RepID=UPI0038B61985
MDPQVWKLVQKRAYDLLSHRYGLLMILGGAVLITVSAFHFGEALLEWSHEKYAAVFNSYSDNLASRSFRERLCLPVPIDVVYTWVNGSDPELILQLRQVKMSMEEQLNISRKDNYKPGQCTYTSCVPASVIVVEGLPYTEKNLKELNTAFSLNDTYAFNYTALTASGKKDSLALVVPSWEQAKLLNGKKHIHDGGNYTLTQAFYTSDSTLPHGSTMNDILLMTGFPSAFTSDQVLKALPEEHHKNVGQVEVHTDKGIAVLHMAGSKEAEAVVQLKNFTIEGKSPAFTLAYMVSDLTDLSRDGDVASSRFEDNEELRYSLRSLEMFAPWIRHVFIITNGQIPHWINLDSPRISVVTHQELFPNKSDLPTFSSPAIESHLHRIPGLSDKFLYLNDDVMFGSEVWPDDFFSYATGQKLYLTWPVPSCNEGCPSNWIRDGYCDKACNSSECEWDGGDCTGVRGQVQLGAGFQAAFGVQAQNVDDYCNAGCANNWIADKYCDQACNHLVCGYDAGDCGTSNYDQLIGMDLRREEDQHYVVPAGETLAYFNISQVLGLNGKVISANHNTGSAVRAAAVSNKYRVLTLILYPDRNATKLLFHLQGQRNGADDKFQLNFTVSVDSSSKSIAKRKADKERAANKTVPTEEAEELVLFEEYPKDVLEPHLGIVSLGRTGVAQFPFNISRNLTLLGLSPGLEKSLSQLVADRAEGDFTEAGFQLALEDVYKQFQAEIRAWNPHMKVAAIPRNIEQENLDSLANEQQALPKVRRKLLASDDADGKQRETVEMAVLNEAIESQKYSEEKSDDGEQKDTDKGRAEVVEMKILDEQKEEKKDSDTKTAMTDEEFLEYVKERGRQQKPEEAGGLPWEVRGVFRELQKRQRELQQAEIYEIDNHKGRQLLDTFGDSLRHVNRLYNKQFGYASRKVPAHMPHMIDKNIMAELQAIFPEDWAVTSAHKVRSPDDMQFAFAYYYYLLGAATHVDATTVFDQMDTDHSGILSDRELRTLATRLNELPLYLETLTGIENMFINCSKSLTPELEQKYSQQVLALTNEQYYDQEMPQVTKLLFLNCTPVVNQIKEKFKARPKYKTTILDDSDVAFKMIQGNVSRVVGQLDDIRKNPKKFICLNDNIDHGTEEAKTVKAVVQDFYESLLPIPSQFELPREFRNRFLHMDDLSEWKHYRDWLRFWAHMALIVLVMFAIASYFGDKIEALQRKLSRRRLRSNSTSSPSDESEESPAPAPAPTPPLLPV